MTVNSESESFEIGVITLYFPLIRALVWADCHACLLIKVYTPPNGERVLTTNQEGGVNLITTLSLDNKLNACRR